MPGMGGGGGGGGGAGPTSQETYQKSTTKPWEPQRDKLKEIFNRAQDLYNAGPMTYFPGSTTVPFAPESNLAMNLTANRALSGSPVGNAAQGLGASTMQGDYLTSNPAFGYLQDTASGGMLNANPYLDAMYDRASTKALSSVSGQFGDAGRYGSGFHEYALGDTANRLATDIYGGNYARERQNQLSAANTLGGLYGQERGNMMSTMGLSPTLANMDYQDLGQLGAVGAARENQQRQLVQEQVNRQQFAQMEPWQRLALYKGIISGNYGGQTIAKGFGESGPVDGGGGFNTQGALSGAASGAAIGTAVYPGIGTAVGAVGGGLMGGFL